MSLAGTPGRPGFVELRALSWRIFIHVLEYPLTLSRLAGVRLGAFSIILVGNQIDALMFVKGPDDVSVDAVPGGCGAVL
jgi:hypothetical protein